MLEERLDILRGVGPKRAHALADRFGLRRAGDLLLVAPLEYRRPPALASEPWKEGEEVYLRGVVRDLQTRRARRGTAITRLRIDAGGRALEAQFFHRSWLAKRYPPGSEITISGRFERSGGIWRLARAQILAAVEERTGGELIARYPRVPGISERRLRGWIAELLVRMPAEIESSVSPELEQRLGLPPRAAALRALHQPRNRVEAERACRRLALEELCEIKRRVAGPARPSGTARILRIGARAHARILRRIPFDPTPEQRCAMASIRADLAREQPMARLLVGDVGTGKTAVAIYAILAAIGAGSQALLMAPTEALARQHHATLEEWLRGSRVRQAFLGGSQSGAERRRIHAELAGGELDLVVATHALLGIAPPRQAGVVVIDEQHRFGTRQKQRLFELTPGAHYLAMSATPIPRTWLHALWGNLDISTLEQRPPGRQEVKTHIVAAERLEALESWLAGHLRAGGRGLWICPRVLACGSGTKPVAASVMATLERLSGRLENLCLAPLHGRDDPRIKAARIAAFRAGEIHLLVASSLIEVGMDFPTATCLVVEDATRFGLVQLHQMRGRIGRGRRAAHAFFLAPPEGSERLEILERLADGQAIAELDLHERGPGALLGFRQHGLLRGRFFHWKRDLDLLKAVTDPPRMG